MLQLSLCWFSLISQADAHTKILSCSRKQTSKQTNKQTKQTKKKQEQAGAWITFRFSLASMHTQHLDWFGCICYTTHISELLTILKKVDSTDVSGKKKEKKTTTDNGESLPSRMHKRWVFFKFIITISF